MSEIGDTYLQGIAIAIIVLNSISMASLLFVIGVYATNWKTIASFPLRLSFYLCLACLGQNITVLTLNPILIHSIKEIDQVSTAPYCTFEGVMKVTFDLSSIIWTALIIYSVYASIVLKKVLQKMEILYLMIGFVFPLIAASIPAIFNVYEFQNYYCWFGSDQSTTGFWLRMGYFFIPMWVLFIANMTFSVLTYRKLKDIGITEQKLKIFKRIVLFPLIIFVCGLFATISIISVYVNHSGTLWIKNVGLILLSSYGICNSLAYGFNPIIREKIVLCLFVRQRTLSFSSDASEYTNWTHRSKDMSQIEAQLIDITNIKKVKSSAKQIQEQKSQTH